MNLSTSRNIGSSGNAVSMGKKNSLQVFDKIFQGNKTLFRLAFRQKECLILKWILFLNLFYDAVSFSWLICGESDERILNAD
jgi:hypothetical protein